MSSEPICGPHAERKHNWWTENRRTVVWLLILAFVAFLLYAIKEITTLLLLSYAIAVLLDPLVTKMERQGLARSSSILALFLLVLLLLLLFVAVALPAVVREYSSLIVALPDYLKGSLTRVLGGLESWLGIHAPSTAEELSNFVREQLGALDPEQLRRIGKTVGKTMLSGYSFALTIVNLFLLPFFVFYTTRDLKKIHRFFGSFLSKAGRKRARAIGTEVLGHVQAFFRGQLTVSLIMAILYVIGFSLVGLPSAIIVGTLAGLLNVVPYLGVAVGLLLAISITLVSDPSWLQLALVLGVFGFVQAIEGTVLTPKIVGESVGIHPLGVILALLIGGQLLGLLGLIIAIPAAAACRVLFRHVMQALDEADKEAAVADLG